MEPDIYFQPHTPYFWTFEEQGEVIAIQKSHTIIYTSPLKDILIDLAPQGLPRFGTLLLVIIATNPNAEEALQMVEHICTPLVFEGAHKDLQRSMAFLRRLASLPPEYKEGQKRKLLFQAIFSNAHNTLAVPKSRRLAYAFNNTLLQKLSQQPPVAFYYNIFAKDFDTLRVLANRFPDKESILKRMAEIPDLTEVVPTIAEALTEQVKTKESEINWLQSLIKNQDTFHIGALVDRIWSGLQLPFRHLLPSQQPLGGFADLTNKGNFDRLLLSEFANEDILLLSRLANNEALYINRETPPATTPMQRVLLLDSSIYNWGTPKTIAFALAVAIAKHPKTNIPCTVYIVGENYQAVSIDTIHQLIDAQQFLHGEMVPETGLRAFFQAYPKRTQMELFFISSEDSMRLSAMQKLMSDYAAHFDYWIETSMTGGITLYKRQHKGKKHIQHIELPLEELWTTKPKTPQQKHTEPLPENRKIDFPILFPIASNYKTILLDARNDLYIVTPEKMLLRLRRQEPLTYAATKPEPVFQDYQHKGLEMIWEHMPFAHGVYEIGIDTDGDTWLLMHDISQHRLIIRNLTQEKEYKRHFSGIKPTAFAHFIFYQNHFWYLHGYNITTSIALTVQADGSIQQKAAQQHIPEVQQAHEAHKKRLVAYRHFLPYPHSFLKNVHKIMINTARNLVVNGHELRCLPEELIDWRGMTPKTVLAEAERNAKNVFTFKDGSKIEICRAGAMILTSSNTDIPPIYVPLTLDVGIGVATSTEFAGHIYYLPPNNPSLHVLKATEFWKQYISPFIQHILQLEAKKMFGGLNL